MLCKIAQSKNFEFSFCEWFWIRSKRSYAFRYLFLSFLKKKSALFITYETISCSKPYWDCNNLRRSLRSPLILLFERLNLLWISLKGFWMLVSWTTERATNLILYPPIWKGKNPLLSRCLKYFISSKILWIKKLAYKHFTYKGIFF